LEVGIEVVALAGVDVNVIIPHLVMAGGSDKGIGFGVYHDECSCGAGLVKVFSGMCVFAGRTLMRL
jgi:hypothetical protein